MKVKNVGSNMTENLSLNFPVPPGTIARLRIAAARKGYPSVRQMIRATAIGIAAEVTTKIEERKRK